MGSVIQKHAGNFPGPIAGEFFDEFAQPNFPGTRDGFCHGLNFKLVAGIGKKIRGIHRHGYSPRLKTDNQWSRVAVRRFFPPSRE